MTQGLSTGPEEIVRPARSLIQQSRLVRVLTSTEFKLRYGDSALGYVWTLIKPLAMFSVLYVIFGRFFHFGAGLEDYPLYLLLGIVLWTFFSEATNAAMVSVVSRADLLRRLSFPIHVIPLATLATALISSAIDFTVVAAYIAWRGIVPRLDWLSLVLPLAELGLFVLGLSLILSTVYVRLRDTRQVWELSLLLLFYATPIIYPLQQLPLWARKVELMSPLTQTMQDVRATMLYREPAGAIVTGGGFGWTGRLGPFLITVATLLLGVLLFRREEPWLAERT